MHSHSFHLPINQIARPSTKQYDYKPSSLSTPKKRKLIPLNHNILSAEAVTATSTVLISSIAGFVSEKVEITRDSGVIITLVLASILTNLGLFGYAVPSNHFVYDLCWSRILPASLALILFSASASTEATCKVPKDENEGNDSTTNVTGRNLTTKEVVIAVGIPFIIGTIGSILGCIFSSKFQVWAGSVDFLSKIAMSPKEASVAAG